VPILKLQELEDFLDKKISSSIKDTLINYLIDLGLISIINYNKNDETKLIVPLFLLNENISHKIVC
jgi:hypothetical protein